MSRKQCRKVWVSTETCYSYVIPAQAGIHAPLNWTPACAGVTIILLLYSIPDYWESKVCQNNRPTLTGKLL
jgi:hypothetical protein